MFQSGNYINVLWDPQYERYSGDWTLGEVNGTGSLGNDLEDLTRNVVSRSEGSNLMEVAVMSRTRGNLFDRTHSLPTDDFELMFEFLSDPDYNPTGINFSRG
tara:strand:- start:22970 stop:23275 length:306 start_codon:yes stop_codon:yes gene_type:complete